MGEWEGVCEEGATATARKTCGSVECSLCGMLCAVLYLIFSTILASEQYSFLHFIDEDAKA